MRISELRESDASLSSLDLKVNHGIVVKLVYKLALDAFKAPKDILADALFNTTHTDQFWVAEIDELTAALTKFVKDEKYPESEVYDQAWQTIGAVRQEMFDYYTTAANHPPGYALPKLKEPSAKSIKDAAIQAEFRIAIPSFAKAEAFRKENSKAKKKVVKAAVEITDQDLQDVADAIDKDWDKHFGEKMRQKITKFYENNRIVNDKAKAAGKLNSMVHFADYPFPTNLVLKTDSQLAKALVKTKLAEHTDLGAVIAWATEDLSGKIMRLIQLHIVNDETNSRKVADRSKNLSRIFPK